MSTTIDFNALYAEAKRAATKHGAVVDPQYGARKSATQPAEGLASQVVEETEAKCVYLDANGNLEAGSLANYRIGDIPAAYYLPDFITEVEEHRLLSEIYSVPEERWTKLKRRRLQMWGGTPSPTGMNCEALPCWLLELSQLLVERRVFKKAFNHVLINEYEPGQGIMAHEDGPLYIPHVAILSLQSSVMMEIYEKPYTNKKKLFSVYLEPRSLFIFREDIYKQHLHAIEEEMTDNLCKDVANWHLLKTKKEGQIEREDTRVSLTIRVVKLTVLLTNKTI